MEETLRQHLIDLAATYEAATGASRATIGKRALNDNTFYARIEDGSGFTIKTFDNLVGWFSENWPADPAWPEGIERPVKERASA